MTPVPPSGLPFDDPRPYGFLLSTVIAAVTAAGVRLQHEVDRPGGPRGEGDKAPVDVEIETDLRAALLSAWPARFVGEELGVVECPAQATPAQRQTCWVVDPHDGTRDFLRGFEGSSIAVALLDDGQPVLGVVYAPRSPVGGPDLIAWAQGAAALTRNGVAINLGTPEGGAPGLADQQLTPDRIVLLSRSATQRAQASAALTAPASFEGATSIAYRLARVAAGDAVATLTLHGAQSWDLAAGHALLLGTGGVLLDQDGHPVRYANDGSGMVSACFGGAPAAARELASRTDAWARAAQER